EAGALPCAGNPARASPIPRRHPQLRHRPCGLLSWELIPMSMWRALSLSLLLGGLTAGSEPKPPVDPDADVILQRMSTSLGRLDAFRVKADATTQVVLDDGMKIHLAATYRVSIARPDRLRSDELGATGEYTLYDDGHRITLYGRQSGFYATTQA